VKIGIMLSGTTPDDIVEETKAASGLSTVWANQGFGWDALLALTVAGQVPGIRLGTAVVPVPQRHPLVLASQALSVQAATGNRLTLGLGAGIGVMVSGMFGLPTDHPVRRLREYLDVLEPLLRGEPVEHRGETLTAVGSVSVPGAEPPRLLLAALGPAMLRLAGERTDGTVTWMAGPRTLADHVVPTITAVAPGARVVAGLPTCVTHDPDAVREQVGARFGLARQVPEYRAVFEREGVAGPQDVAVVGDEAAVAAQLARLAEAGVTEFMAAPVGDDTDRRRTVELLGALG
jgi:F420-dependent oxidoreductase-like protein